MSGNDYSISIVGSSTKGNYTVNLSGNLSIDNSLAIHDFLLYKAISKDVITVIVEDSDDIDLSTIQLIAGFIKERNKLKKSTYIDINLDESIIELLDKSGSTALISLLQKKN